MMVLNPKVNLARLLSSSNIAQTETEILLAHVLKKDRSFLHAYPEYRLTKSEQVLFSKLLTRRQSHEPLAYILGYKEFFGLKFLVNQSVLIPREETEDLVELALTRIKGLTDPILADIGTGSGCIAVALAVNYTKVKVFATDVSEKVLTLAKKNASLHGVSGQITFLKGDLTAPINTEVDLIVTNLPYITTGGIKSLEPEVKDHEPLLALDGGRGGMDLYEKLFLEAKKVLKEEGSIIYEVDGKVLERKV